MAKFDVSLQRASLLSDATTVAQLPPELLHIIRDQTPTNLLDAVSQAALIPRLTGRIFPHFEPVFADICARWVLNTPHGSCDDDILASFARVLPFSPQLSVFLEGYLKTIALRSQPSQGRGTTRLDLTESSQSLGPDAFLRRLLAVWRLLNFDRKAFSSLVLPSDVQDLFSHSYAPVRYLAIRIFCLLLRASDQRLEALVRHHIPENESLTGDFDGKPIDYAFLSLFEHARAKGIQKQIVAVKEQVHSFAPSHIPPQNLTSLVVHYGSTVLPRPRGPPKRESSLIATPTTLRNLESLAKLLQQAGPILLHGSSGAGKTASALELARELGMDTSLVTLHLNEQTDAKMLIGLYTTGTKPGSFEWRPGILTTAVREGRWVLIEDLDRAPTEVMSTLLPLIERGELLIPNRGETIKAPSSFRILATVRTHKGMDGQENIPTLLGLRFWNLLPVQNMVQDELQTVMHEKYPLLSKFVSDPILKVYERVCLLLSSSGLIPGVSSASERPTSSRDLFKWCRRLERIVASAGAKTGKEPITETAYDGMFMEAIDCFASGIKDSRVRDKLIIHIGELMGRSSQRVEHHLSSHIPRLAETETHLTVGRSILRKTRRPDRVTKSKRPFAPTTHARRLLEQIAVAVSLKEPVLLVGETGIGKTTVVQQLAESLGHRLVAVNLSQQSEVGDLLGGFKPINVRNLAVPLKEEFEDLFASTGISEEKNQKYLKSINKSIAKGKWSDAAKLWSQAPKIFEEILRMKVAEDKTRDKTRDADGQPAKRRKTGSTRLETLLELKPRWEKFSKNLEQFAIQLSGGSGAFAFAFIEGNIVKAVRNGDWVLLDEINLASPDTLESVADLLQSGPDATPSILLSETGEIERIQAHPNFRIFGAMNPATDVGKRDLPQGLRSRFTELYVSSPDKDFKDLVTIIKSYLNGQNSQTDQAADKVANLYMRIKELAEAKALVDGANEVPHFSLRTLTRVLTYVNDVAPFYGLERSLYEGFCMGFLTLLSRASETQVMPLIVQYLLGKDPNRLLSRPPKYPSDGREYVKFTDTDNSRVYWLLKGAQPPQERADYIRTPYVERNLLNLVRATSTRRFPILIQGPTSAGKTSMIEYLAEYSGNKFVRINNHEHTDLQEYLGTYVSGSDGKLKFQEGLLVQAMRQGHWIVLDELNLAPTDILEALNRLLDDNRELLIPETQEIVRPHESFMLFATQNPPGLYGGRKVLSRAFRNRFLELHYDDIPEDELEHILQKRSINTAPSDCKRIVSVYKELSRLRQTSRVFEQKDSFATLRDLFRWALRDADTREDIANNGFMLLAERVRDDEERDAVRQVIETVFKVKIDPDQLYKERFTQAMRRAGLNDNKQGVVWTNAMRRLYILVSQALRNNEPVLLVGETGCGKTTICQLLAESLGKELHIVNAHQNTETGDLIGSQRPVRNRGAIAEALKQSLVEAFESLAQLSHGSIDDLLARYHALSSDDRSRVPEVIQEKVLANEIRSKALFEWSDGSLVHAMKEAHFFLLDEISLADDSVLERLNSVLEPGRSLLLAEKGTDKSFVRAADGFQFFATMNPGGDFGKKELSPALRNRFTEIWVPPLSNRQDILDIVVDKLEPPFKPLASVIVDFSYWFGKTCRSSTATAFSIRDILVWVNFVNHAESMQPAMALLHGAATVFIDTLGANPSALLSLDPKTMDEQRQKCLDKLNELLGDGIDVSAVYRNEPQLAIGTDFVQIGGFSVARMPSGKDDSAFAFDAPTTKMNLMRVIRALAVNKPVLLEGNPGVGKTTLVSALAQACGRPLTRINLSDQTDLMDLFGTDVPVEGAEAGNFAWRDAPFLQAMQKGEWVLLDEMNLASQSVLEGLNACLDHRGEVYVSELDQVFKCHPDFKLFAAQNPHSQGGGRKGLPSSFVNRFIVVYADVFTEQDLMLIAGKRYPNVPAGIIQKMIRFVSALDYETSIRKSFGSHGSPWEFNLRDSLRWLELLASDDRLLASAQASDFLDIIVTQRFRSATDREYIAQLFTGAFEAPPQPHSLYHSLTSAICQVGLALLDRNPLLQPSRFPSMNAVPRLAEIESLLICVKQNLPCILVGPSGSGKSSLLNHVAASVGKELIVFPLNADVDAMDLVGGFEQADPLRELHASLDELQDALLEFALSLLPQNSSQNAVNLISLLDERRGDHGLSEITVCIEALASEVPADSLLGQRLTQAHQMLNSPRTLANPRFEWLDGVIVRAMEAGKWLVLDNANLCSASVLDRLNSLLERPNGFLSINEHTGPDGEPRIIKPHSDFRIFLTMDPCYGELSRAMRNRSIEIYLEESQMKCDRYISSITPIESSMRRYGHATHVSTEASMNGALEVTRLALDNLSLGDASLLAKYEKALANGLGPLQDAAVPEVGSDVSALVSYVQSPKAASTRQAVLELYAAVSNEVSGKETLTPTQPLHTLHNGPMASLTDKHSPKAAEWLAFCYEVILEIQHAQQAMQSQIRTLDRSKPSTLNRLQRSLVSGQVATVAKDSTVNVAGFLSSIIQLLERYIESSLQHSESSTDIKPALRALLHYWWRTFHFVTGASFEEAKFQAHLKQGIDALESTAANFNGQRGLQILTDVLDNIQDAFTVGFKLTTGLSMETLWTLLRPAPVTDQATFLAIREMEKLAIRFDAIRWRSNASVADLSEAISSLAEAYSVVRKNAVAAADLLHVLQGEIERLEANANDAREVTPFFEHEFETLRQALTVHRASRQSPVFVDLQDVVVLSNIPTLSQMRLQSWTNAQRLLHCMEYVLVQSSDSHPWNGQLMSRLINQYDSTASAGLFALQSLEIELPAMGKLLAGSSEAVSADSIGCLNQILWHLMREVVGSHDPLLLQDFVSLFELLSQKLAPRSVRIERGGLVFELPSDGASGQFRCPEHSLIIFRQHFIPAVVALVASEKSISQKSAFAAVAWVHFAIGCIILYVPDKIFDPYLRAQTERNSHEELLTNLRRKWQALCAFEASFTGQASNLRAELLREEIEILGEPPAAAITIYRPSSVDLARLQGEFNNVLNAVVKSDVASAFFEYLAVGTEGKAQEVQLVKENVLHLIERLSSRFQVYEDLTMPLVTILRCLQLGLSLGTVSGAGQRSDTSSLLGVTPMLGGSLWSNATQLPHQSLEFLSYVGLWVSVNGIESLDVTLRQLVFQSVHYFYEEWSKKLDADKRQEAARNSLYRYKGGVDEEEEADQQDFNELFPDYEMEAEDHAATKIPGQASRNLSLRLAERHERIFLTPQDTQQSMVNFCKAVARKISGEATQSPLDAQKDRALLPGALLVLDEKTDNFTSSTTSAGYNFYTSANLFESRKLVNLVHGIQMRFRELQHVDEIAHLQPLADVLGACEHVLELSHSDPLAKIIPRVEKLVAFVYEWQHGGWASHIYGALNLYNRLTETVVSWRRLELATWAKLFDMEVEKCQTDAKSWWFVAYHAVIAIPMTKMDLGQDLRDYTVQLVSDLEMFFSEAVLGEFQTRLGLLRQLSKQLGLLVLDYAPLQLIHNAVLNFISMYRRYESKVAEATQKGRASVEKAMKDVLMLASWKDTNIVALRESARKSHQKLFKLVRKFRAVLGQPMRSIIDQGLPDESHVSSNVTKSDYPAVPKPDDAAASMCRELIPGWLDDAHARRLSKAGKIISIMSKASQLPESTINAAEVISTFLSDTMSAMASLKQETPAFLNDENKEQVKHLKTRKTRLFEDTIKAIRTMGFTRNLNEAHLRNQKQLAAVLAKLENLPSGGDSSLAETEYYFLKVLDLAPQVRNSLHDHNGDLTNETVRRSTGYMEGIIHVLIQQRSCLADSANTLATVDAAISNLQSLIISNQSENLVTKRATSNHSQLLRWLIPVLNLGLHLIEVHGTLGKVANGPVRSALEDWLARFTKLQSRFEACQRLSEGLDSDTRSQLREQLQEKLDDFEATLQLLESERPDLGFIFEQLQIWTTVTVSDQQAVTTNEDATVFVSETLNLSKKVLDAVQKLQKAAASIPTSTEDASWLLQYNDTLANMLKSLHMRTIVDSISDSVARLDNLRLDDPTVRNAAFSLLAVTLPLLQQYSNICRTTVTDLTNVHCASSKMALNLGKAFVEIASRGFCTPQEKSDETSGDSGKLESGTGLGDGEGAEDISKDIQPDEDLSELAQEPNKEKDGEIEDQEDAVDMGQDDMEGEMGSAAGDDEDEQGNKDGEDEEDKEEMDEETGDVDDLDPTAVDEKMWDGDGDDADKDQQGDDTKGQKNEDEQVAAKDAPESKDAQQQEEPEQGKPEQEVEEEEEAGPEQDDAGAQEELNRQDQNVEENEALALPEDMDIDGSDDNESAISDDDLDNLSDVPQDTEEEAKKEGDAESVDDNEGEQGEMNQDDMEQEIDSENPDEDMTGDNAEMEEKEPEPEEQGADDSGEKDETKPPLDPNDNSHTNPDNAAPSDVKSGAGLDQNDMDNGQEDDNSQAKAAQRESGEMGQNTDDQQTAAGNEGAMSRQNEDQNRSDESNKPDDSAQSQPFKKLGDALERWYRQNQDIKDSMDENQEARQQDDSDMAQKELQHLQNDDDAPDAQALGTAAEDEVQPIDESMAIDEDKQDDQSRLMPQQDNNIDDNMDVDDEVDGAEQEESKNQDMPERDESRSGVATRRGAFDRERSESPTRTNQVEEQEDETIEETSTQLDSTHLSDSDRPLRDYQQALETWTALQTKTHPLSLALTSQLRLILTPSQSTKLSGSYRTGKRLNIKKIIPYIASSYKRDKIWMRRAVPTKRTYQILLCVDDSQSMGHTTAGAMALESLVMVSRALAMLEAGQVGVVGFGADVFTAHELAAPLLSSHDAGARVLQNFTFAQDRTDVALLIRRTLDQLRAARATGSGGRGGDDLWQLALILSDGLTPSDSHERIRRMLREALEERVMVVFIIMDDSSTRKGDSVLQLGKAKFVRQADGISEVVIERYLDTFPFQYYLIVHNLEELPGALAGLLRTWFAEVNS
ncbi:ATPase [Diaporthe amygdali]|uniref:ATPase n=1 Tax=Phomopsis amygdali TaxID=1214568 RepID=UPI0022FE4344|nr:ATPase [Diaporthe amygdali]KAJ0116412.1 ATPase [Diaporthe amygdali]